MMIDTFHHGALICSTELAVSYFFLVLRGSSLRFSWWFSFEHATCSPSDHVFYAYTIMCTYSVKALHTYIHHTLPSQKALRKDYLPCFPLGNYIGTTCSVLLVFQFQHLRKQQPHSKVINYYKYVHEVVLIIANNMWCTQQIFEKSVHVRRGIYIMVKLHAHEVVFIIANNTP